MDFVKLVWTLGCLVTLFLNATGSLLPNSSVKYEEYIQVVKFDDFPSFKVIQCKIWVSRQVYKCDRKFLSFFTGFKYYEKIPGGYSTFVYKISRRECLQAYKTGSVTLTGLNNYHLKLLKPGDSEVDYPLLRGWISTDSDKCGDAGSYDDEYYSYKDVVVKGYLSVSIRQQTVKLFYGKWLFTASGTVCIYDLGACYDSMYDYIFWETAPSDLAEENKFTVEYSGKTDASEVFNEKLYVTNDEQNPLLLTNGTIQMFNKIFFRTQFPRLFIYVGKDDLGFIHEKKPGNNIDLNDALSKWLTKII